MTEFFLGDFSEVYGIDISEKMVEEGKARLGSRPNVRFSATNGLDYPFPEGFFDFVFSFTVFQHMPDRKTVRRNFEEVARVLNKRGVAKIQLRGVPVRKSEWFYGPAFDPESAVKLYEKLSLKLLKQEGEGQKYYWLWLEKT